MSTVAVELAALGDTQSLWEDWLSDARRRYRIEGNVLDRELPNWGELLARFAEERAPVYLRPDAGVSAALRRLQGQGTRIGVFTDAPEPLARVALAQLGAARRIELLEVGPGALHRLLAHLGPETLVLRTRSALVGLP